jgi:glycosyltransferase involved in cell wall biosynthesis
VLFIGFRDNIEGYMADFNLLFMTSLWEGLPITILEAINIKIPIFSTDVGGIYEIIGKENVYRPTLSNREVALKLNDVHAPIQYVSADMAEKYVKLYRSDKKV